MSTNSMITIVNKDGTCESIYCHWDGYYSHNGVILDEHYPNESKVRELIKGGSLSILGAQVNPNPDNPHTFDNAQKGVCVYYGRDRGESWDDIKPVKSSSKKLMLAYHAQEYNYFYSVNTGKWSHKKGG